MIGDWGLRTHVTWFALSNFVIPLVALSYYYVKICNKIRRNLRAKKRMLPQKKPNSTSMASVEASLFPDLSGNGSIRPRAHSLEGISRAKIRSVQQTVVVIVSYVICSAPVVVVQLWNAWINESQQIGTDLKYIELSKVFNSVK